MTETRRSHIRIPAFVLVGLVAFAVAVPATAGVYTDELSKCLVSSTSDRDRTDLVVWIFSMMALHPDVAAYSAISEAEREQADRAMADLMERLLTDACLDEAREALRYEGGATFEAAFSVLGSVATRELMSDPRVTEVMAGLDEHLDADLLSEALGDGSEPPEPEPAKAP